jgi:enoyl-CoA hydratase
VRQAVFAARAGMNDDVLYARDGRLGRIMLNRPKVLNVLNDNMVTSILAQLLDWAGDDQVAAVSIQGSGERGLCAGGDIRALRKVVMAGSGEAVKFWAHEYRLNAAIASYPKPFVAFMDGIVMGGGVGLSAHGSLRLVTERARVAMPETAIGFSPDVGSLFLLSRAPGETGTHLALTGLSGTGADAVYCGLADALIASSQIPAIIARLAAGESLDAGVGSSTALGDLAPARAWIDPCYASNDALTILRALRAHPAAGAQHAAEILESRSPLAVCIALEAIRRASRMDTLSRVLEQDLMLAGAMADSVDFVEGVRALLIDRDNAPHWHHRSLSDVDLAEVARVFTGDHKMALATRASQRLPKLEPAEKAAAPPREDDVE